MREFFQWFYESEIDQINRMEARDGFLSGIAIVLSGVFGFYIRIWPWEAEFCSDYVFYVLASLFAITLGLLIFCLWCSIIPRDRAYISRPQELSDFNTGLIRYYRYYEASERKADKNANAEFFDALTSQFIKAGERNREFIEAKAFWQTWAKWLIGGAIVFVFLNSIPTIVVYRNHIKLEKTLAVTCISGWDMENPSWRKQNEQQKR